MRREGARRQGAVALVLLAVMGLELAHLFAGWPAARAGAHGALMLLVLVAAPRLGLREAYLLALSGALTFALWSLHPRPFEIARLALDQASFLMAFILLISLVQEGARTSPSVAAAGNYLARQPGSRRFLALYAGSNLMSPVFNLGTVSLIAPLVRRAAQEAPDDPLTPVRERRQLSAILRGFAWSVVWSPTAVAPLAVMQLIDGIDRPLDRARRRAGGRDDGRRVDRGPLALAGLHRAFRRRPRRPSPAVPSWGSAPSAPPLRG